MWRNAFWEKWSLQAFTARVPSFHEPIQVHCIARAFYRSRDDENYSASFRNLLQGFVTSRIYRSGHHTNKWPNHPAKSTLPDYIRLYLGCVILNFTNMFMFSFIYTCWKELSRTCIYVYLYVCIQGWICFNKNKLILLKVYALLQNTLVSRASSSGLKSCITLNLRPYTSIVITMLLEAIKLYCLLCRNNYA